ncbi:hypothetical protein MYSTI_01605 [Myxococcus stipitatus DSM 14675]|uniref:Lipoprotein n=1 Tax=Myxococcus stipitatus (strain DSM 14675 / JCM 12634 / Mx s8) TaxID=1278073 RepID=L7U5U0_MYXSD|nr:hypothetical protein [Myxococcus stipitatus]AGC42937.1 hypothetical protein MYSTI_01605 [Myxococcus stipitatus DSM 14675]
MRNVSMPALLLSILAVGITMAVAGAWGMGMTRVRVINASERELRSLEVKFPGRVCHYEKVALQAEVRCEGRADRDGYVEVSYRLGEGAAQHVVSKEYVSPSMGWRGSLLLRPDGSLDATESR